MWKCKYMLKTYVRVMRTNKVNKVTSTWKEVTIL